MASRVDGTQKLQLTSTVPKYAGMPRWSPDGKQIVFFGGDPDTPLPVCDFRRWRHASLACGGGIPSGKPELDAGRQFYRIRRQERWRATGIVKMIEHNTSQVTAVPDSKALFAPVASPDGRYIAGASIDGQTLWLFDFSTGKWSELLKTNVGSTNWSADSKYIYFDTGLSENPAFYRVRVADRKLERLADLKGFRRVVSGLLPWSGVTPDGAPLLLRDISSQEVYALDFEAP